MEDWVGIIGERLNEGSLSLPSDDWDILEKEYLSRKRSRKVYPFIISFAAAAAAVLAVVLTPNLSVEEDSGTASLTNTTSLTTEKMEPYTVSSNRPLRKVVSQGTLIEEPSRQESEADVVDVIETEKEEPAGEPTKEKVKKEKIVETGDKLLSDHHDDAFTKESRKRIAFASHVGGGGNRSTGEINTTVFPNIYGSSKSETVNHHIPFSFGVDISYFLNDRLALTSGLEAAFYRSEIYGTDQRAWYIGIPLKLEYTFWQGKRLSSWIGAGGKIDRCIYAAQDGKNIQDDVFNKTLLADSGIRYDLYDNIGLYIAPEITWCFTPEKPQISTYRTENPFMFTFNAGVKFSF